MQPHPLMNTAIRLMIIVVLVCGGGGFISAQPADDLTLRGETKTISTTRKISGDATGTALQSARTGSNFHIIVDDLPSDKPLQLDLGFAELEKTSVGDRLFNVNVNGKRALTAFDIVAAANGPFKSVVKRFSITPENGSLDFHFVGTKGDAAINYIQISGNGVDKLIAMPSPEATAAGIDPDDFIASDDRAPFEAEQGVVKLDGTTETWNSGVPIGGIGTGKFELLPNGQFGNFTINNSWDLPVLRPRGTFVAIAAKISSGRGGARLLQVNPANHRGEKVFSGHDSMDSGTFTGEFPFGRVELTDEKFPLEATIEGWSPLIPHNTDDSSLPGGVVNVLVENPEKYPVAVGVVFSWEDISGRGGSLLPGDQHGYSAPSQHMDAATTGVKGFQIVSTQTAQDRASTFAGDYFIGTPIKGAVVTRSLAWNPRTETIPWWSNFSRRLRLDRTPSTPASVTGRTGEGPMASSLCVSFNLAPGEIRRVPFIVTWNLPRIITLDSTTGQPAEETQHYAARFASSLETAAYLAEHRLDFREQTEEWVDMIDRATVPQWLKTHALNSLFPLRSNSILLSNARFAMLASLADMKGMLGPVDLKLGASDFTLTMFPDLERTELNLYARAQDASGRIPRYIGNIHGALAGFDPELLGTDWYDPTSAWLLQIARYWKETGDDTTLEALRPAIVKARDYLVAQVKNPTADNETNIFGALAGYPNAGGLSRLKAAAALRATQDMLGESSPDVDTLIAEQIENTPLTGTDAPFAALLAGEYAARAAATAPFISSEDVVAYLQKINEQNFAAARPVPRMSGAGASAGQAVSALVSLQPYVGALALQTGLPDIGISPYVRMFQVAYGAQKAPWKQALLYDVPAAAKPAMRYHRAAMSAWSVWRGLSGVVYDKPNQRMLIQPASITTATADMEIPVFTPDFWAWLQYNAAESTGTLAITRVTAETTPTLLSVASKIDTNGAPVNLITFPEPLLLEEGATLQFEGWPGQPGGTVIAKEPPPPPPPPVDDTTTGSLSADGMTTGTLSADDETTGDLTYQQEPGPEDEADASEASDEAPEARDEDEDGDDE